MKRKEGFYVNSVVHADFEKFINLLIFNLGHLEKIQLYDFKENVLACKNLIKVNIPKTEKEFSAQNMEKINELKDMVASFRDNWMYMSNSLSEIEACVNSIDNFFESESEENSNSPLTEEE